MDPENQALIKRIVDELGTEKFSRFRIGIGDPVRNARDHVLSRFEPDEVQRLDELLDAAADGVGGGIEQLVETLHFVGREL